MVDSYSDFLDFDDNFGFSFNANLAELRKLSPAISTETYTDVKTGAVMTKEEADAFIQAYCNTELSRLESADEGEYAHSMQMLFQKLNKKIIERETEILRARNEGKKAGVLIEEITKVLTVLRDFIRTFCRAYILYAPTIARKTEFPYSTGNYVRSSIIYFTNDESSRARAISSSLVKTTVPKNKDEFIFGEPYVLEQLEPSRLFERGNVEENINRVLGGITIENLASKNWKGESFYYGWSIIEREGWKLKNGGRKPPYSPFQHAMEAAKSVCTPLIDVALHDDYRQHEKQNDYFSGSVSLFGAVAQMSRHEGIAALERSYNKNKSYIDLLINKK